MRAAGGCDLRALGVALLLALVAGCGPDEKPPLAPPAEAPPPASLSAQIEAVFPAARSTGVFYDTDIWVRFAEPLAPATVNERTIFFKLDTVRIPVTLAYDGAARTLRLTPGTQLALLRTYTVEITPGVQTADGRPLSQTSFWQFRTNGLRRLTHPTPATGVSGESPFTLLRWGETEPSAGSIVYRVYAGVDSAAIAARGSGLIYAGPQPDLLPPRPWGLGNRIFWAVTAVNQTSVEQLDGPVWSFEILPLGLPVDSLLVPANEWGYYDVTTTQRACLDEFLWAGPRYRDGIHWTLREAAAGLKLAGARVRVYSVTNNPLVGAPAIFSVKEPWASCTYSLTAPAASNTKLADAVRIGLSPYGVFESDALTATLEAVARYGFVYGFTFRASQNSGFLSPLYRIEGPRLTLYYYRVPPAPGAAQGP